MREVMMHPWVNEGYPVPPFNYVPPRPHITDLSMLDSNILRRLFSFGHKSEEVKEAFLQDPDSPNPIRCTYFLLHEMLQREEAIVEKQKISDMARNATWVTSSDSKTTLSSSQSGFDQGYGHSVSLNNISTSLTLQHANGKDQQDSNTTLAQSTHSLVPKGAKDEQQSYLQYHNSSVPDNMNIKSTHEVEETRASRLAKKWQTSLMTLTGQLRNLPPRLSSPENPLPSQRIPPSSITTRSSFSLPKTAPPSYPPPAVPSTTAYDIAPRKASLPITLHNSKAALAPEENMRTMTGWFLNVSTTSSKPPPVILQEITRALSSQNIWFNREGYVFECECWEKNPEAETLNYSQDKRSPIKHFIAFQIEGMSLEFALIFANWALKIVCKVPKVNLFGLHFKRLAGGVWTYKKVCTALVNDMSL
jgi:MAP/microtubule affinity-regulating kinase